MGWCTTVSDKVTGVRFEIIPTEAWAETVARELAQQLKANPRMRVCLPTGTTPRPFYEVAADVTDFSEATAYLLDEFGLPAGDPARCDQMIRRDLLDRLPAQPAVFDRLDPDAEDLDVECSRFRASVGNGGLDLVILGLGANGHLGLNEPGSLPTAPTRVVAISDETRRGLTFYGAIASTTWGLTLGLAEILAARQIWLLVTGDRKRDILARSLIEPIGPDLPATFLRRVQGSTMWADQESSSYSA